MPFKTFRIFLVPILFVVSLIRIESSFAASPSQVSAVTMTSSNKIAQGADADLQRRIQEQREAERVLKEGENLKREVRDNNYFPDRGLERQVGEQINKIREPNSNPQRVREADAEITRLRQQNNSRPNYYYDPYFRPYYNTAPIIFAPGFYNYPPSNTFPEASPPQDRLVQTAAPIEPYSSGFGLLVSSGFKDGKITPGLGVKYKNIGFEIAGIFNQDSLPPVTLNDFPLPSTPLFSLATDLGKKKLSAQWGADVLGFLDVDPRVAVYGSVGLYFQSVGQIVQSGASNELFKQTNETETTGAIGGGVNYKASDAINLGIGYHSLRGVTARIGINF